MKIFWFLESKDDHFSSAQTRKELKRPRTVLVLIAITLATFLVWARLAEIDQITRAPGTVIASSKTQVIQSQEGGVLATLLVKEGDKVEQGQVVAFLEKTQAESSYLESEAKKAGLLATITRLRSEVFGQPLRFDTLLNEYPVFVETQSELFAKRQAALIEEVESLETMASLISKELDLNRPLLETGDVSRADVLRLERQYAEMKSQITNVKNEYFRDAQTELSKAEEELASIQQQLNQRQDKLEQTKLTAPVNGIVKNISINTEGGVVRPGEELMQIVPVDDALVIEAKVTPSDIAFLELGLPATIKLDAYDYTIYGDLSGVLSYISADTLLENKKADEQPYYRIQVRTEGKRFKGEISQNLEILPGMTGMVELKTGTNTILSYITKPLIKTISESMSER